MLPVLMPRRALLYATFAATAAIAADVLSINVARSRMNFSHSQSPALSSRMAEINAAAMAAFRLLLSVIAGHDDIILAAC